MRLDRLPWAGDPLGLLPAVPVRPREPRGRPLPRPVRPLRRLRQHRGGAPHLHGPLRPAAPRPGVGGHRRRRRPARCGSRRAWASSTTSSTRTRLAKLPGDRAIGHVRYSTAGDTVATNAQPYLIECHRGPIAVGHNGNLVNATILRQELEAAGSIFQSTSDTEVILHLYARSHRERLEDAIAASLSKVMGAFSLLFLTQDALVAARDPWGFRPLVHRAAERRHRLRLRDLRARPDRRRVRARRRAGRDRGRRRRRAALAQAVPARAGRALRLRARLLRAARQPGLRPHRAAVAHRARPPARARDAGRGRRGGGRARQRHRRGARLLAGERDPVRVGPDPQPLRGPHLHPAAAGPALGRRQDQAQPGARRCSRAGAWC